MSILAYDFVQRALLAALVTGLAAPAVGTYLVQRRQALLGDGIGHLAVAGVAIGLLTNTSPTYTAIIVAIIGGIIIETVRNAGKASADVALALLFYGGIAAGVMITGIAGQSAATLNRYLFGSITSITSTDVWITVGLAVVLLVISVGLAPQLFAVAQDEEYARVAGLHVRAYNLMVTVMAAVTVTVAMRTVGLLLVSALMVVPVATTQQLVGSFRPTLLISMGLGALTSVSGVVVSSYIDVAPGATIVLLALALFAAAWPLGILLRRRRLMREPFPATAPALVPGAWEDTTEDAPHEATHAPAHDVDSDHPHVHGPECGHIAVQHGDHVDYVHEGHRHAEHEGHYDEH